MTAHPCLNPADSRGKTLSGGRPDAVGRAVKLLYIAMVLGLLRTFINAFSSDTSYLSTALLMMGAAAFHTFFIEHISRGRNWARFVYFGLALLLAPLDFMRLADQGPVSMILWGARTLSLLTALYLVFFSEGKTWYLPSRNAS